MGVHLAHKVETLCTEQVTAILVLAGLPRVMAGAILAHECMHAWLRLSGVSHMQPQLEEGLCQLMASLWLGSLPPSAEVPPQLPGSPLWASNHMP